MSEELSRCLEMPCEGSDVVGGSVIPSFDLESRRLDINWSTNQETPPELCLEWGLGQSFCGKEGRASGIFPT